jgi:hypothetical protein
MTEVESSTFPMTDANGRHKVSLGGPLAQPVGRPWRWGVEPFQSVRTSAAWHINTSQRDGSFDEMANNLSITGKSLISTLLGVLVLLVMAWLAIASFIEAQRADDEQGAATEVMSQARDAWIDLARGHAALYRAINLKSQNVEVALVRGAKNDAVQAIDRARKSLASLKTTGLSIDTQLVTNFEYRINIFGPVNLAPFVDFGINKIVLPNQLKMNPDRVDQLNGDFPQAGEHAL